MLVLFVAHVIIVSLLLRLTFQIVLRYCIRLQNHIFPQQMNTAMNLSFFVMEAVRRQLYVDTQVIKSLQFVYRLVHLLLLVDPMMGECVCGVREQGA